MRWIAVVAFGALAAGCRSDTCSDTGGSCTGGNTCTRNGECLPPSQVRMVKVTWTIGGMPASATTCASVGDFALYFQDPVTADSFGYEPVPCMEGQFTIDRIPTRFSEAAVNANVQPIGSDGTVAFNF